LLPSSVNMTFLLERKSTSSRVLVRVWLFEVEMGDKNPCSQIILFLCFLFCISFLFF